ncbi:hypothetical protein CYMTET_45359 [Cymbomonas tetramitiformis]|uniref:Uncharacterized protein n=1 Tax=Cymbomonas tetramitiformis TaxID=36881 RepID=A0AAE0BZN6_9CHLO|nr:hypothetical protein CYMTET_45359 [Cymbomonas tetramitiformis]
MKLQAEHSALVYPAKVDPRPILAKKEQQLIGQNRAEDWTPTTAATRKQQLWESLDPDFYAAVRVHCEDRPHIENLTKTQRAGGAAAVLPNRTRKGLAGFRADSHTAPHVGLDGKQRKALPKCLCCPTAGDGHRYHSWFDCSALGGKRQ